MKKIIELDEYFPKTGELTVQPILLWNGGRSVDTSRVTKYASAALDYIKSVAPERGKTALLLNALGAEETYGPNRNGDGFPEFPVPARGKIASADRRWFVPPGEELTHHYASFETNPARTFLHHANRDPAKASGVIKKAFWNPRMHRVELLALIDDDKDPEWVKRASDGEFVPVSMGCRIKRDVCARCGNEAPTRADYCDHVKFAMNVVDANGFKDYVHNPSPDFFDLSRVFRPADRIGYTLKKVAESVPEVRLSAQLGEESDALALKGAAAQKLSDIEKVISGEPIAIGRVEPGERAFLSKLREHLAPKLAAAPRVDVDKLARWPLGEVLTAAAANDVVLRDEEFATLVLSKTAADLLPLAAAQSAKLAAAARQSLELFADRPALLAELLDSGVLEAEKVAAELMDFFARAREKRAYSGDMLYRRLVPEGIGVRPDAAPTTDVLNIGPYQTTRGAAIDAMDAVTRQRARNAALGGGALMLGGYKALGAFPFLRKFRLPIAAGLGALGATSIAGAPRKTMTTDEGYAIPDITELTAKTAALVHLVECARGPRVKLAIDVGAADTLDDIALKLGAAIGAR